MEGIASLLFSDTRPRSEYKRLKDVLAVARIKRISKPAARVEGFRILEVTRRSVCYLLGYVNCGLVSNIPSQRYFSTFMHPQNGQGGNTYVRRHEMSGDHPSSSWRYSWSITWAGGVHAHTLMQHCGQVR